MAEEKQTEEKAAPVKENATSGWEPHISKSKKRIVEKLVKKMEESPIIGAVNMEGMPAPSLQKMREKLRGKVKILMTKGRLMRIALDEAAKKKKGLEKLKDYLRGMPALMFTSDNPFSLYKTIKANKSPAPAKGGQTAPKDIVVPAGPTPFAPGPIISELGGVGIAAGVEDGKVAVKKDSVVAKEGDVINAKLAGILTRLGIEPMEVGLDITGVFEDGVIYDRKVLDIDEDQFISNLNNCARWGFNLAVEIGHFTPETVAVLVPKAFREAKAVALEGDIINDVTREEILVKAERQALGLKTEANIDTSAPKPAPAKEEEKPAEEPAKEEAPKEEPKAEEEPSEEKKAEETKAAIEEEIEHVKKEVKEEEKKEVPDAKHLKEMDKEVDQIGEEIKDLEKSEEEKEKVEELKKKEAEVKEEVKEEIKKAEEVEITKAPKDDQQAPQQAMEQSEKLFDQLKKKGTLRGVQEETPKPKGDMSPQEIIEKGVKETKAKSDAPSAHDLAAARNQK